MVFGGNVGLSFGTYTRINVSPKIGYRLDNRWIAGVGGTYQYLEIDDRFGEFYDRIYGGNIFTNYRIFNSFLLVGRYELLNVKVHPVFSLNPYRTWQPGTLIGLGYRQGTGGKVLFDINLMYNLTHNRGVSPYNSSIVWGFNLFIL